MERNRFSSSAKVTPYAPPGRIGQVKNKAVKRAGGVMLAVLAAGLFMASGAQAALTYSGNLNPADPSLWTSSTSARVGDSADGTLAIDGGSTVSSSSSYLGYAAAVNGTVTVTGSGSNWTGSSTRYVGYNGSGVLHITNGGTVNNSAGYLGYNTGSTGAVTVDGSGSLWTNSSSLTIGRNGNGSLNITNGGAVSVTSSTTVGVGRGTINFGSNGGTLTTSTFYGSPSQMTGTGTINASGLVSDVNLVFNAAHPTTQTVTANGITFNLNQSSSNPLGAGYIGSGTLTIADGVSVASSGGYLGYRAGSSGTATVTGAGSSWNMGGGNFNVGYSAGSTGAANFLNGGSGYAYRLFVGDNAGYTGSLTVDGPGSAFSWGYSAYLGTAGSGTMIITNGGHVSGGASASPLYIANNTTGMGRIVVDGVGSSLTVFANSNLTVGGSGTARLSISDGGAVRAGIVYINSQSILTVDVGKGSSLTAGGTDSTISSAGTIRLVAGAGAAAGTYTPINAGTISGTVQALGGIWDATAHTVTVSSAITGAAGSALTADLATTQRFLFTDGSTGKSAGAGFQATASPTNLTMTASSISGSELTSLQSLLGAGQAVLSGWDFSSTEGYTTGNPVYLSLFAGTGHSLYDLTVWHYDGSAWSTFDASDLAYDQAFASFTATGLSGYAVSGTAPVPVPPAAFLFGSGLAGLGFLRRKFFAGSR